MNLLNKISYGLFLLAAKHGNKNNACIINTFSQQTSLPERVSFTLNKDNFTHSLIKKSGICSILLLDVHTDFGVFQKFGMTSGKNVDKFNGVDVLIGANKIAVPKIGGIGIFELKVVKSHDLGTHTLFICDIASKKVLSDTQPLTYSYYHANIKPKPVPTKGTTESFVCSICGYIHYGKLSNDFVCPICKHGSEVFQSNNENSFQSNNEKNIDILATSAVASTVVNNINNKKGDKEMSKFICSVCGYVHEGEAAPEKCPQCGVPASKFTKQSGEISWAAEHVVGVAKGVREDILEDLRANFNGECTEVGMYLAMARVATREGFPEIAAFYEKAAWEEAEHAAKFAELLGEVVTSSTEKNLKLRADAENGATLGKFELAKKAKELNLDAIHDTVHEMARDEARHGKGFLGLLTRYFS